MNEKNEPVNFEVIYQVTDRFIDTFSFLNVSRDDNEHIYMAVDDKTGDGLSYDCSYNTLKISFGKEEDMNVLYKRFCQYYTYIQKKLRKEGHMLTGMGINPRYVVNQNVPVVSERYRMLFHHLLFFYIKLNLTCTRKQSKIRIRMKWNTVAILFIRRQVMKLFDT